ncbi:MAG: response regulator transcription factor [Oscillatoriophycideae cyanobacterium NC_groundwater_1537_Pr4_S-0.65um_50_18]|nr:response regulator transcription factor [Oscillatoriophycideae cyanobacterium NC_groundwater_1537_Pr4_S-0.65um_50_18]
MPAPLPEDLPNRSGLTRILIIRQEARQSAAELQAIETGLRRQGYHVDKVNSDKLGLLAAHKAFSDLRVTDLRVPDLIVLDGLYPQLSSLEVCRRLRAIMRQVPIILLTPTYELSDSITEYEAGADDCIVRPFKIEDLLVRIRVRLRHTRTEKPPILRLGGLTLDCQKREAYWQVQAIQLTSKEFDLLKYLILHYQQVVPRHELIDHLWGAEYDVGFSTIDTYVCRLRSKLEQFSQKRLIQTVYGVGYRLCC